MKKVFIIFVALILSTVCAFAANAAIKASAKRECADKQAIYLQGAFDQYSENMSLDKIPSSKIYQNMLAVCK